MDALDEADLFLSRPIGVDEPPPKRRLRLRPFLVVLGVAILGGALGTGAYFASTLDTRDVIGLLDVADQPPRLAIEMPGRKTDNPLEPAPATATAPMLRPPGSAAVDLTAPPVLPPAAETPPPASPAVPPAHEAPSQSMVPPVAPPVIPPVLPATPAAPPPIIVRQESPGGPQQPLPRPIDKPPAYANLPAPAAKPKPLGAVPAEGMTRPSGFGPLPVIAADGRQSWQVYARPFEAKDNHPRMAVIVTGLGMDREATDMAIDRLPPEVTLAFSPYAGGLDNWVKKARDAGHEVLLTLPVEESGFPARDPGPWGLLTSARPEDNAERLQKVLARTAGYVGVLANDGPFTKSRQLAPILAMLKERGLLYVGNGAEAEPKPPVAVLGGWLDGEVFRDAVESRQKSMAGLVREKGSRAVLASARPATLESMLPWLGSLTAEGVTLAPVSALPAVTAQPPQPGGKS
ncbi:MAG: skin secretory protein xP2 [Rhodospirillaceae bacterium]|nr:MAG: skin secretory protein xP2 [Rhodospirillaceae bacterium]TNC94717.1 MAG: skin secretory protein xP2 precursor [Stygiobacter sp.]